MARVTSSIVQATGVGRPDYASPFPLSQISKPGGGTAYTLSDVGELAARVGSIVTYDRRGDVYFIDDFEHGIETWDKVTSGAGAAISWTTERSFRGGASMKLIAGSTLNRLAQISRQFAFPSRTRLGFEAAWTIDMANLEAFQGYITLYTGTVRIQWGFKTDLAYNYVFSGGIWKAVSSHLPMYASTYLFFPAKVVVNAESYTYTRFLAGPMSFPLASGLPCSFAPDAGLPRMEVMLQGISKPGMNALVYFDSIILTQNEPEEVALAS